MSLFLVLVATAILGFGGLVHDAGAALVETRRLTDIAETAARAGVMAGTAPDATGAVVLDPERAYTAATEFLAEEGLAGEVTTSAEQVEVSVRFRHPTTLLQAVGIPHLDVSGTGVARPLLGLSEEGR